MYAACCGCIDRFIGGIVKGLPGFQETGDQFEAPVCRGFEYLGVALFVQMVTGNLREGEVWRFV